MATFGHIGDGNIHFCVICDKEDRDKVEGLMEPAIFYWLKKVRGSISAEHGIGFAKANYLNTTRDESVIQVMK